MKAITQDRYGPADVLRHEDVDTPVPKDDEVLLRVRAASVNRGDWHLMRGDPVLVRILGYGLRRPKQRVLGQDVAGVVEAVGAAVTRFQPGDEVFGFGAGTFAEYACIPEKQLERRPAHLSLEAASTLPVAATTALHALRDQAALEAGQQVLIVGSSGGVGSFAVQLAKAYGAEVTGVCSTRNLEHVRSIGADHVIDYTAEDFAAAGPRYDVIVRISGDRTVGQCRRALRPRGTLVIVGGGRTGRWLGGMERFLGTALLNLFTRQRLRPFISMGSGEALTALKALFEEHSLEPVVGRRVPLAEVPEAMRAIGEGHTRGKIVVVP